MTGLLLKTLRTGAGIVLISGAALFPSCGGDDASKGDAPERVASWDAFVESGRWQGGQRHPVVFIGIDGGNWRFVNRLINEGRLPGFERLMREGSYGVLESVENHVTPPAWTSIFSGYLPEKHGIYTFGSFDRASGEFLGDSSDDILVPMVWDAASRAGLRCGIVNVPVTYPPRPVNGVMVSGMLTPIEAESAVPMRALRVDPNDFRPPAGLANYSQPLPVAATDGWNAYLWTMHDTRDDGRVEFDTVALRVFALDANGVAARELDYVVFPVGTFSRWLLTQRERDGKHVPMRLKAKFTVNGGAVQFTTSQSVYPMASVYTYPEDLREKLDRKFSFYLPSKFFTKGVVEALTDDTVAHADFLYDFDDWDLFCFVFSEPDHAHHQAGFGPEPAGVYERIDTFLVRLMERMPKDGTLIIGSDHGFDRFEHAIDLNVMLQRMGLLEWEGFGRLDHERTLVFHNLSYVYYNRERITREALESRGIEVPDGADPIEFLRGSVRATAAALLGPGGRPMPVVVRPVPEGAQGRAPDDIVDAAYDGYMVEFWNLTKPATDLVRKLEGGDQMGHHPDGIYLFWGGQARKAAQSRRARAVDVGPTILHLLGLPLAPDMDGEILFDVLESGARRAPVVVNDGYRDIPREKLLPDGARESLRKKLRSLGYIQ